MRASFFVCTLAALALMAWTATAAYGDVIVPDNGTGTAHMPIHAAYSDYGPGSMHISDGLPAGTTIEMDAAVLTAPPVTIPPVTIPPVTIPPVTVEVSGGSLGGTKSAAAGSGFLWNMQGTGDLADYRRTIFLPLGGGGVASLFPEAPLNAGFEVHAAPRMPGAPVQSFNTDMFQMFGEIANIGDPDFDLLRIVAGTDFGMPSPGHTTLTQLGGGSGGWAVDSFFDIEYRIDFIGAPGGSLAGRSGSTTGTIRMGTPEPGTLVLLTTAALGLGLSWWARRRSKA